MRKLSHDNFAKQYLVEMLYPFGIVELNRQVKSHLKEADIFFVPPNKLEIKELGLLGNLVNNQCLIEVFYNPLTSRNVRNCLSKLFDFFSELEYFANRNDTVVTNDDLPRLLIISPIVPAKLVDGFAVQMDEINFGKGIYSFPDSFRTRMLSIHQLPRTMDTIFLRILGRGKVQIEAINELFALPINHPLRDHAMTPLLNLHDSLTLSRNLSTEDRSLIRVLANFLSQIN
jgi:hypothetical protein